MKAAPGAELTMAGILADIATALYYTMVTQCIRLSNIKSPDKKARRGSRNKNKEDPGPFVGYGRSDSQRQENPGESVKVAIRIT